MLAILIRCGIRRLIPEIIDFGKIVQSAEALVFSGEYRVQLRKLCPLQHPGCAFPLQLAEALILLVGRAEGFQVGAIELRVRQGLRKLIQLFHAFARISGLAADQPGPGDDFGDAVTVTDFVQIVSDAAADVMEVHPAHFRDRPLLPDCRRCGLVDWFLGRIAGLLRQGIGAGHRIMAVENADSGAGAVALPVAAGLIHRLQVGLGQLLGQAGVADKGGVVSVADDPPQGIGGLPELQ